MVAVDESLFSHLNKEHVWLLGLINLRTNDIRLELVENRNRETLKKIIEKYVMNVTLLLLIAGQVTSSLMMLIQVIIILNIIMQMDISDIVVRLKVYGDS